MFFVRHPSCVSVRYDRLSCPSRRRFLMDSDDFKVVDTLDIRGEGTTRPSGIGFEIRYNFQDNFEIATLRG